MVNKNKVLIVEDSTINRKILHIILSKEFIVVDASNGEEAWNILLSQKNISAVVTDLMMPKFSGFDLINKMKFAQMELPIIVSSSNFDTATEEKVLNMGAWDFVPKPYNPTILITRLKSAIARSEVEIYKQLQDALTLDKLTGLYNKDRFFEQTKSLVNSMPDKKFAFVKVDIKHFSLFNSSFGQTEGNKLLYFLSQQIKKVADGEQSSTYGRINADIFCFCIPYVSDTELNDKILKINKKISSYKKDYLLDIATGICIADKSLNVDSMYFRSSYASKECKKQQGKVIEYFTDLDSKQVENEIYITSEMKASLQKNEFKVFLQPKVDANTEKICGAEALVRWIHPEKGIISPGEFIPIFEKNGFISKLDYYVWDKTCQILKNWKDNGIDDLPISVNISRVSLYNPSLPKVLSFLTKKYDISPDKLQLEITESAYMSNPTLMNSTIKELHDCGFKILMDDFGRGYSSLNTLKDIQFDVLKVDINFLSKDNKNLKGNIILESIIKMAKTLGMQTIIEGVEQESQKEMVKSFGCNYIQGYYYSKPIQIEDFESKFLKDNIKHTAKCFQ